VHYAHKLLPAKNKNRNLFITNKLLKMEVLDSLGKRWLVFCHRKISAVKYLLRNEGRKEGRKERKKEGRISSVCHKANKKTSVLSDVATTTRRNHDGRDGQRSLGGVSVMTELVRWCFCHDRAH